MNTWLSHSNSDPSLHNHNAGLGGPTDSPMAYLQPPQTINPAQFQNQPYLNGNARTVSPSFQNPIYQTNSVVPSKRQRDDNLGQSPRQAPGGLPGSRSQTPSGAYPGYNPQSNGAQFPNAPTPYQHLQNNATSNATPSPTIQQMAFNNAANSQRPSTASPSPFSPHHGAMPQMSPAPSDHNSRVATPHDNQQNMMQGMNGGQGFNPAQFQRPMGNPQMNMGQPHMQPGAVSDAQRQYQLQIQAQVQAQARHYQQQAAAQARMANGGPNPGNPMTTPQQPGHLRKPTNPDDFIKGLQSFMAQRGRTVEINPTICGRQLPLIKIFQLVMRMSGSASISKANQWTFVAQQFGFPPQLQPQAGQELVTYWINNLAPYEGALMASQQQKHMRVASQGGQPGQPLGQMSPTRAQPQDTAGPTHQRHQSDMTGVGVNGAEPNNLQQPSAGQTFPQPQVKAEQAQQFTPQHRSTQSLQQEAMMNGSSPVAPTPSPQKRLGSAGRQSSLNIEPNLPIKKPIEDPFQPEELPPSRYHGPVNVEEISILTDQLMNYKPSVPRFQELGLIDIHALTMSIKSGIHAETRMALDTLVTLSLEPSLQLVIEKCDDLMETLIECAQDQVDFLAEHSPEVSDEMQLSSYEDLMRGCRMEGERLQRVPRFGSVEYDLDRAADRLICITTLMRNFSFWEANFAVLGMAEAIRLLSNVIRYLGTREMFLRNNRNILDFMKDVVIYLSNLSHSLELPGKEEALCLLHLLLAFAPMPAPFITPSAKAVFTNYNPNIHKYLPAAVDTMAKLLARDEPNRTYYKAIFAADSASTPAYDLLTRAFGLAIAPLPTNSHNPKIVLEARKPFILQGMLAAEILANLAPGSEVPLAKSWLESEDGWAPVLLRLLGTLSIRPPPPPPQPNRHGHPPDPDPGAHLSIASHSLALLRALVQKSRTVDNKGEVVGPVGIWPKREMLMGALMNKDVDSHILRLLCNFADLED
jgi:SWI/SNF chromatin-remodeling complex subunit SWI1